MRFVFLFLLAVAAAGAQSITGLWHAAVKLPSGDEAFFDLDIRRGPQGLAGSLRNGPEQHESTAGRWQDHRLRLEFNYWDGVLEAEWKRGTLEGAFTRRYRKEIRVRPFRAARKALRKPSARPQVNAGGEWTLEVQVEKKPQIWHARFDQTGSRLQGTLIPVSGDYGVLTGFVEGRSLLLTHFDGIRANVLKASIAADGTLSGILDSTQSVRGWRPAQAPAAPPEPTAYTRLKNPAEPFRFSYPSLDGTIVSSADERFRHKVLLINITGSWCPNCHEETPFLIELYRQYQARGFEIVALAFEYTGDTERDLRQLHLFARKYRIPYPVLLAGTTEDAQQKLDQLENFAAYPTNIYIGRDGRVRRIHAGFDGPATGERHTRLKREMREQVETLLGE